MNVVLNIYTPPFFHAIFSMLRVCCILTMGDDVMLKYQGYTPIYLRLYALQIFWVSPRGSPHTWFGQQLTSQIINYTMHHLKQIRKVEQYGTNVYNKFIYILSKRLIQVI